MLCHSGSGTRRDRLLPRMLVDSRGGSSKAPERMLGRRTGDTTRLRLKQVSLPSNAFSRKPRGSHAPEIRHPGQEMVLRWGDGGSEGEGKRSCDGK